jgi:hypothetical protein
MIEGQSAGNENTRREGQALAAQADDYCPFALPLSGARSLARAIRVHCLRRKDDVS